MFYRPSNAIVVQTGIFATLVGSFLCQSYTQLFPNPADTTNALLVHISQKFANCVPFNVDLARILKFEPSSAAIWINTLWFLTLIFSLASALNATLLQQCARRYLYLARPRVAPHKCARTRPYMFDGVETFKFPRVFRIMPMLLHISVFLFSSSSYGSSTTPSVAWFSPFLRRSLPLIWC